MNCHINRAENVVKQKTHEKRAETQERQCGKSERILNVQILWEKSYKTML